MENLRESLNVHYNYVLCKSKLVLTSAKDLGFLIYGINDPSLSWNIPHHMKLRSALVLALAFIISADDT